MQLYRNSAFRRRARSGPEESIVAPRSGCSTRDKGALSAPIFGLADRGSQSGRGDVSTFRKAQKYIRATPKQSSTSSPPNSATRITSLLRVEQTFQPATQAQRLGLCPNQDWPRHRPDKLANTRQNLALLSLPHKVWASRNTQKYTARSVLLAGDACADQASLPA